MVNDIELIITALKLKVCVCVCVLSAILLIYLKVSKSLPREMEFN